MHNYLQLTDQFHPRLRFHPNNLAHTQDSKQTSNHPNQNPQSHHILSAQNIDQTDLRATRHRPTQHQNTKNAKDFAKKHVQIIHKSSPTIATS
jgi:hypothetical protein